MRCFCTGCTAKTSTVTESSVSNTPNYISNTDSHQSNTDQSRRKRHSKKNKKLDTKKTSQPTKESVSNMINYDYQSCKNSDIEEKSSKRLKTEEDVSSKDQDLYGDIVLWERPGDNVQTILEVSAAVSGMTLKWNYFKKEEGW